MAGRGMGSQKNGDTFIGNWSLRICHLSSEGIDGEADAVKLVAKNAQITARRGGRREFEQEQTAKLVFIHFVSFLAMDPFTKVESGVAAALCRRIL
jgi:hypothetical protein